MVQVTRVRFEHHEVNTIGIGESEPRISWSFEGDEKDWIQSSYELEILRSGSGIENTSVKSSNSRLVSWVGKPLASGERAEVRVRVTGNSGVVTEWSEKAIVEAGLLNKEDWKCSLIEPGDPYPTTVPHRPVIFRRQVNLSKTISSARLYITAHGLYEAQINSKRVGDHLLAPGWTSYSHRLAYQTFDVTTQLVPGENSIHVEVGEGWFCGRFSLHGGRNDIYGDSLGLVALFVVQYQNGESATYGTDNEWNWAYGPRVSSDLYDGEVYDENQRLTEQNTWHEVKQKPISSNLVAPDGPPVRQTQEMTVKEILKSPSGKTILDFGQNFVGWLRVTVDGPARTKIHFQFVEVLEKGEVVTRTLRAAKANDTLILAGDGPITWEPKFTFHGFRYVEVQNWPGELNPEDIRGIVAHSDMQKTGTFSCSNQLLNKLHSNVTWSMRGNFLSIPTDCPQRDERLGWTGDINVFAETANYLYDTTGMLSSWLRDLYAEQVDARGIVPLTIPNTFDAFSKEAHAIWGDVAVMLPWSLFLTTGDSNILARQYASMKSWIETIPRRENGLWNYTADWKLGDWLDPAAPPDAPGDASTDPTLVSDAFLVHITTLMSKISHELGQKEDEEVYTAQADKLRKAYAHEYITPAGLLAADTQTALALSISFSLFPTSLQETRAAARLSHIVRANSRFKIATGFAGTPYIGSALSKTGNTNLFYRMLLHRQNPSWLYPVTMGATTIWERWDSMLPDGSINPGEMTSFNHYALGAVAGWMHAVILGLSIVEPGWRVFKVAPVPGGGLKFAEGGYMSAYGEIGVRWEFRGERFWMEVRVPINTRAEVVLPGSEEVKSVGSGKHVFEREYVVTEWPPRAIFPPGLKADDELPEE